MSDIFFEEMQILRPNYHMESKFHWSWHHDWARIGKDRVSSAQRKARLRYGLRGDQIQTGGRFGTLEATHKGCPCRGRIA